MAGYIATAGSIDHGTPLAFIERARKLFGGQIDLDPCSNSTSIIQAATEYVLPKNDGLVDPWALKATGPTNVWENPPFGRYYMHIRDRFALSAADFKKLIEKFPEEEANFEVHNLSEWVKKTNAEFWAFQSCERWAETVMILPAAVDTANWQDIIFPNAVAWLAIRGRVKYLGAEQGAPMASALAYWGRNPEGFEDCFSDLGRVYECDGIQRI